MSGRVIVDATSSTWDLLPPHQTSEPACRSCDFFMCDIYTYKEYFRVSSSSMMAAWFPQR